MGNKRLEYSDEELARIKRHIQNKYAGKELTEIQSIQKQVGFFTIEFTQPIFPTSYKAIYDEGFTILRKMLSITPITDKNECSILADAIFEKFHSQLNFIDFGNNSMTIVFHKSIHKDRAEKNIVIDAIKNIAQLWLAEKNGKVFL